MWIRNDEVASLVQGEMPASLTRRIVRYHFVDNTRGEPPFWRADEIVKADLTLNEGRLIGRLIRSASDPSCRNLANARIYSCPFACLLVTWRYGSIRMEPVFMVLGQSAATAASLAIDDRIASAVGRLQETES